MKPNFTDVFTAVGVAIFLGCLIMAAVGTHS